MTDKAAVAIALRDKTYSTAQEFGAVLTELRVRGNNVLTAATFVQSPKPMHEFALTVVMVDTHLTQVQGKDPVAPGKEIYRDPRWPRDQFALTHKGLLRLWNAAGGAWLKVERTDDRRTPHVAEYQATGCIKDLEGDTHERIKSAGIDYRNDSAQVAGWSEKQIQEGRKKLIERCESLAQNRVIRELLNIKDSYTLAELAQPYVLAKLVFRPDMSDPIARQMMIHHGLTGTVALYGPVVAEAPPMLTAAIDDNPEVPPVIDEPAITAEERVRDFMAADPAQQLAILRVLVARKAYDTARLEAPIEKMDRKNYVNFYKHLASMPDA